MCGGGSNLKDLARKLETAEWNKKLPFARKPTVHFIKPSDVENIVDQTGTLDHLWDITPMSLANMALDLVGKEALMDSILNKIVSNLRE
jgi:hypothetical protein